MNIDLYTREATVKLWQQYFPQIHNIVCAVPTQQLYLFIYVYHTTRQVLANMAFIKLLQEQQGNTQSRIWLGFLNCTYT